jgi:hypothetical protein
VKKEMFVAQRELKVSKIGSDKMTVYHPGDVIPDFDKWPEQAKRSHINLEWVIKSKTQSESKDASKLAATPPISKSSKASSSKAKPAPKPETKKASAPKLDLFRCHLCPKEFKSPRAVNVHATLAHKPNR